MKNIRSHFRWPQKTSRIFAAQPGASISTLPRQSLQLWIMTRTQGHGMEGSPPHPPDPSPPKVSPISIPYVYHMSPL